MAATMAASTDLLWTMMSVLAQWRQESPEATISTIRQDVVSKAYPDATS